MALNPVHQLDSSITLQGLAVKHPWPVIERMIGLDFAAFDGQAQCPWTDA